LVPADRRETVLFTACEYGHEDIVDFLLNESEADSTIQTAKGLNCLDVSITNHHEAIVTRLLNLPNWRKLMESAQLDENHVPSTPMRKLIIYMPDIAYELIDKRLTHVTGGDGQVVYRITYDYRYFDDQYNVPDWLPGK
jgi:hypothetical protein